MTSRQIKSFEIRVTTGEKYGYFQNNLHLWDIAAGIILIKEAGGRINKIDYSQINEIKITAASNIIYDKMLEKLNNF